MTQPAAWLRHLPLPTLLAAVPAVTRTQAFDVPGADPQSPGPRLRIAGGGLLGCPFGVFGDTVGITGGIDVEFACRSPGIPIRLDFNGEFWQHSSDQQYAGVAIES
jgi:hypothetical protein